MLVLIMNRKIVRLFFLLFAFLGPAIGCEKIIIDVLGGGEDPYEAPTKGQIDYFTRLYESVLQSDGYYHDVPTNQGVKNVKKRVDQFLNVTWIPYNDIPQYPTGSFRSGIKTAGIPYSFGAESDGIVGLDISLDSFITAVNNPYSFIYTVDLRKEPYNEILAGAYYGVVCSSAVAFFLGMDFQYVTYLLDTSPWLVKYPQQSPDQIRIGDIIWQENHVMLIYDIARDANNSIVQITLAEGNVPLTRSFSLSYDEFLKKWEQDSYIIYCYTEIGKTSYTPSKYVAINGESINEPAVCDICTARGDKVCFKKGDAVIINTISTSDSPVSVYKDGIHYGDYVSNNHTLVLTDLEYGSYEACLGQNGASTSFSVVDYDVQVSTTKHGLTHVSFDSKNAKPSYVAICNSQYRYISIYPLTLQDLDRGYINISATVYDSNVRVFFDGEYGRVSSKLLQVPS